MGQPVAAPAAGAAQPASKFPEAAPASAPPVAPQQPAARTTSAGPGLLHSFLFIGGGLGLGVLAFILWRRSQRAEQAAMLRLLGTDPAKAGIAHVEFPPVDLHRPIAGEAAWRAIRTHAADATYFSAVEAVRDRFAAATDPMALSHALRTTMAEERVGFREAMLRLAAQGEARRPTRILDDEPDANADRHGPHA